MSQRHVLAILALVFAVGAPVYALYLDAVQGIAEEEFSGDWR